MGAVAFISIIGFAALTAASLLRLAATIREDRKRLHHRRDVIREVIRLQIGIAREDAQRAHREATAARRRLEVKQDG
jgi:hypothetical protein